MPLRTSVLEAGVRPLRGLLLQLGQFVRLDAVGLGLELGREPVSEGRDEAEVQHQNASRDSANLEPLGAS